MTVNPRTTVTANINLVAYSMRFAHAIMEQKLKVVRVVKINPIIASSVMMDII